MPLSPKMTPPSALHTAIDTDAVHVRAFLDPIHERILVVMEVWVPDHDLPVTTDARTNTSNVIDAAVKLAGDAARARR